MSIRVNEAGISQAVQWLRLHLPMQEVWLQSLIEEVISHLPHHQKAKTLKKKERERNNILTNSIKTLKMVHRENQKDSMRQHFKYFLGLDKGSCSSTLDFFLKIY